MTSDGQFYRPLLKQLGLWRGFMDGVAGSADGLSIHFEAQGTGKPAIVFVHGWSGNGSHWKHQLEHFAPTHQVVAVDLAGSGQSDGGRGAWTMKAFGQDVVAVVEHLGLEEVVLVGHSLGTDTVVEAAVRLPGRVIGIVWVGRRTVDAEQQPDDSDGFIAPFKEDFVTAARDLMRRNFGTDADEELVEWVAEFGVRAEPEVALEILVNSKNNDPALAAALQSLSIPVVVINGDHRTIDTDTLHRYGVQTVSMPGVGHFAMLEDPDAFNRLLTTTIESFQRG
jgi:pimeloyl-ACP methyl ester carboxylesterase